MLKRPKGRGESLLMGSRKGFNSTDSHHRWAGFGRVSLPMALCIVTQSDSEGSVVGKQ